MDNDPKRGLVVWYNFAFKHEIDSGHSEGIEDHRCVIIGRSEEREDGSRIVALLPITHSRPRDGQNGVRIAPKLAKSLGLDNFSWIKTSTVNYVEWPKDERPHGISAKRDEPLGIGFIDRDTGQIAYNQYKYAGLTRRLEKFERPHEPPEMFRGRVDRAMERLSESAGPDRKNERPNRDHEPER